MERQIIRTTDDWYTLSASDGNFPVICWPECDLRDWLDSGIEINYPQGHTKTYLSGKWSVVYGPASEEDCMQYYRDIQGQKVNDMKTRDVGILLVGIGLVLSIVSLILGTPFETLLGKFGATFLVMAFVLWLVTRKNTK